MVTLDPTHWGRLGLFKFNFTILWTFLNKLTCEDSKISERSEIPPGGLTLNYRRRQWNASSTLYNNGIRNVMVGSP